MPFAPNQLPGLRCWLRASDLTGTHANGAAITSWTDASGNSLPAIQIPSSVSLVATPPTFATGVTGTGGPAVRFDRSLLQGLYLGEASPLTSFTAGEVIVYFKKIGTVSDTPLCMITYPVQMPYSPGYCTASAFTNTNFSIALPGGTDLTQWNTFDSGGREGYWEAFLNGTSLYFRDDNEVDVSARQYLGAYPWSTTAGYWFDGYIAEFMVYDRMLSTTDRLEVRDYLLETHEGVTAPDRPAAVTVAVQAIEAWSSMLVSQFGDQFTDPALDPIWVVTPDADDETHMPTLAVVDGRLQWDFDATWGWQEVDVASDPSVRFTIDELSFQAGLEDFDPTVNTELWVRVAKYYEDPWAETSFRKSFYWDIYEGHLYWGWGYGDDSGDGDEGIYDPVAHNWLKVSRDEDDYLHFYASPNGQAWTELGASTVPMTDFDGATLDFWGYHDEDGGRMVDTIWVDNINVNAPAPLPEELTALTATINVAAGEYPTVEVAAGTAAVVISAVIADATWEVHGLVLAGATAALQIEAGELAILPETYLPGDPFEAPELITGSTGSFVANITTTTLQAGEGDLDDPTGGSTTRWESTHTYWARYTPPYSGILTLTSPTTGINFAIDVYEGASLATAVRTATVKYPGAEPLDVVVSANQPISIRVRNMDDTWTTEETTGDATIAWALTSTIYDAVLQLRDNQLPQAPGAIVASAFNFAPDTALTFRISGTPVYEAVTDDTGTLAYVSIPVEASLAVGTYSLSVTASDSASGAYTETAETTFTVLNPPLGEPTMPVADSTVPVPVEQDAVVRWVFQDPLDGGLGSYRVPINPAEMTTPRAPKVITVDHTTAADGQAIFWQGGRAAYVWSFRGYLETQEHYEKLAAFAALNRRFWIIDHRNRGWVVTITNFDPQPRRNIYKPWAHNYEVSALIYRGPVAPE